MSMFLMDILEDSVGVGGSRGRSCKDVVEVFAQMEVVNVRLWS